MNSVYLNPSSSSPCPIPNFLELKGDHQYGHNCSLTDQVVPLGPTNYSDESWLASEFSSYGQYLKVENALSIEKYNDLGQVLPSPLCPQMNGRNYSGLINYSYNPVSNHRELGDKIGIGLVKNSDPKNSKKWKPSKVRIMQKMMATSRGLNVVEDQQNKFRDHNIEYNNNNNNNGAIRVCSDCQTTTTPLWRSGPQGPKSLCNACGIRQRKARRATMAAAATTTTTTRFAADNRIVAPIAPMRSPKPNVIHREEMTRERGEDYGERHPTLPVKKRGMTIEGDHHKGWLSSSNNKKDIITPNYYCPKKRAMARDEEEGAILLMALSSGLLSSP